MRPSLFRLTFALATFLCGFHLVNWRDAPPTPRVHVPAPVAPTLPQSPCPPPPALMPPAAATEKKDERAVQEEFMDAPGIGRVRVIAYEPAEDGYTRLNFTEAADGENLLNVWLGASDSYKPRLRFRVMRVKGVAGPLVVAVMTSPGASDSYWEASAVGVVDGSLEVLTYEELSTSEQGGFFFGDLGGGRGTGAAQWEYVSGEGEGHYGEHQYEVKLYKWNPKKARFEWSEVLRTTGEFSSGVAALRSLGLRFDDIRGDFAKFYD